MFNRDEYMKMLRETSDYLKQQDFKNIKAAIILGSGLNEIAEKFETLKIINYSEIPNFLQTTVEGHKGRFVLAKFNNHKVLFMQGRFHYYEGYPMHRVVFPIRVFSLLSIDSLIVTNASGGINPDFKVGDVMIITDHIAFFMPENPLRGPNLDIFGPRFISMQGAYDKKWIMKVKGKLRNNSSVKEGIYCMVPGPNYESPAELNVLKIIGVDAVGMSTVPEVIVARHCGMKVIGFSVITDVVSEVVEHGVTHEEVLENTKRASEIVEKLIRFALETVDE